MLRAGRIALGSVASFAVVLASAGWLYLIQPHSRLPGPAVGDALPLDELGSVAPALRRRHTYFWLYTGKDDGLRAQNSAFARALAAKHVPHAYFELAGGHNWAIWRGMAWRAYLAAAQRLKHA